VGASLHAAATVARAMSEMAVRWRMGHLTCVCVGTAAEARRAKLRTTATNAPRWCRHPDASPRRPLRRAVREV
jgi:hypothetical protein